MRRRLPWLLVFVAGWALGWFSHQYHRGLFPETEWLHPAPLAPHAALPRETEPRASGASASGPVAADALQALLDADAPEAIVAHLERLRGQGDGGGAEHARLRILEHARRQLEEARYTAAERLLERYLMADHRDIEARELLARVHHGRGEVWLALETLYEARGQAYRPEDLEHLTSRIRAWVGAYATELEAREDHGRQVELYAGLVQLEPDHAPYFLDLAHAQLAAGDVPAARQSLAFVLYDLDVGPTARALMTQLEAAPRRPDTSGADAGPDWPQPAEVALTRAGDHFLVEALANGAVPLRLMIDTGASLTVIRPSALERIRYRDSGRLAVLNTANGRVSAPILSLDGLAVGEWQVDGIEIGALEIASALEVDGLLGMNFLKHFQFFIDQGRAVLRLSPDSRTAW